LCPPTPDAWSPPLHLKIGGPQPPPCPHPPDSWSSLLHLKIGGPQPPPCLILLIIGHLLFIWRLKAGCCTPVLILLILVTFSSEN
jgi:hypothetical protein